MAKFTSCKICKSAIKLVNQTYHLVECDKCGLIFSENIFSQEEFVEVYNALYNGTDSSYQRHSKDEFEKLKSGHVQIGKNRSELVNRIIINNTNCKSVLEIGSGIGLVGSYVKLKAPLMVYKGIELDTEAYLKSKVLGLDTFNGDFQIISKFDETFDVIMLWEVIEHLQDLNLFLELAYSKLNKGGKILLSTPNYNKIHNYPDRKKDKLYQNEPPIHLNFFTKKNIKTVFKMKGFYSIEVREKKFPYIEKNIIQFIKSSAKALLGKYNGPTLYLVAEK